MQRTHIGERTGRFTRDLPAQPTTADAGADEVRLECDKPARTPPYRILAWAVVASMIITPLGVALTIMLIADAL